MMTKDEKSKVEVKVSTSITVPFWTMGFLYTVGALLSQSSEAFFAEPWHIQLVLGAALYILWPVLLGMIHFGGL